MHKFNSKISDTAIRQCRLIKADCKIRQPYGPCSHSSIEENERILSAISEIIATIEAAYCDLARECSRGLHEGIANGKVRNMVELELDKRIDSSWQMRKDFSQDFLGATLATVSKWPAWLGYVEVRNAWMHGRGRLTKKQLGKDRVIKQIKQCTGVALSGELLVAEIDALDACIEAGEEVLKELDQQV